MRILRASILLCCLSASAMAQPATQPSGVDAFELAPNRTSFDDPTWHGAADGCPVWNEQAGRVFVYYTTRRAAFGTGTGVEWMFGASIGIASTSNGADWKYEGIAKGDHQLSDAGTDMITWWAPHVFRDDDTYHMYVTYVDGIYKDWDGNAYLKHFTSSDGLNWIYQDTVNTGNADCIDPGVIKIGDTWWMWFKDPKPGHTIWTASSADLKTWKMEGPAFAGDVDPRGYEAPFVFEWKGEYWLIVDTMQSGCDVYKSKTAKRDWQPAGRLWGAHMGVLNVGDRRFLTRHRGLEKDERRTVDTGGRQTVIDMQELEVNDKGELVQRW